AFRRIGNSRARSTNSSGKSVTRCARQWLIKSLGLSWRHLARPMAVQDDSREQELCNLFNLVWDPDHARGGEDAWFETKVQGVVRRVPVEVKSATTGSISTARDVGLVHIRKWREKIWVI